MSRITCIILIVLGVSALAASTAVAADSHDALIVFVEGGRVSNDNVEYIFMVGSTLHQASPLGGNLVISTCRNGQTEIRMAHRTRHLSHGESLSVDKAGSLVWFMPTIPSSGELNRLKVVFELPRGKSGPTYCLRVTTQAYGGVLPGPLSSEYPISLTP